MEALQKLLEQFGVSTTLLIVVVVGGWRVCRFLCSRLFDEHTGLVPIAMRRHLDFVSCVERSVERQSQLIEDQTRTLNRLESALASNLQNVVDH
jgi:hypothetical protein